MRNMIRWSHVVSLGGVLVRVAVLLTLVVATSGCVSELLQETQDTVRNHTCALLDPQVQVRMVAYGPVSDAAIEAALATLARAMDAEETRFSWERGEMPDDLDVWATEVARLGNNRLDLHVVALPGTPEDDLVVNRAPGILMLHAAAIEAAASQTGRSVDDVWRIALLHGLGHAFGVVNAGTPFNGTQTEGREGPQHHEPSPRSIMHAGWHNAGTAPRTNATYHQFSAAIQDDWRAGSVCP